MAVLLKPCTILPLTSACLDLFAAASACALCLVLICHACNAFLNPPVPVQTYKPCVTRPPFCTHLTWFFPFSADVCLPSFLLKIPHSLTFPPFFSQGLAWLTWWWSPVHWWSPAGGCTCTLSTTSPSRSSQPWTGCSACWALTCAPGKTKNQYKTNKIDDSCPSQV